MKKLLILITATLLITACDKDFLELNPNDSQSSASFWKTENDYTQALTACYGMLQHPHFSYGLPTWDNLTDNAYGQHNGDGYGLPVDMAQGNIDATMGGFVHNVYIQGLKGVVRVNVFLNKLQGFSGFDNATKKKYEAEARMLRAYFYSYLYRCYGEVPIITEPLDLKTQFKAKSTTEQVYNFMMQDIDFAIANLSDKIYSVEKGRWTRDAAKAYKARMLLYTAYDDSGNAIATKMQEVQNLLSSISGYSLATEFSDNFLDLKQETCPEIMMSVKFLAPNNYTQVDMWYGDWIVVGPLANFVNEFENADGTTATVVAQTNSKVDVTTFTNASMTSRDPRLSKTIFSKEYFNHGTYHTPSNNTPTGLGVNKFLSPNLQAPFGYSGQSQQDWVIMRYADVLLMRAEAENELSGATSQVYADVNQVRARVGMPALPIGLSKEQMRARIRHERRVELAFEGERYFDLKRWKIAEQVINAITDGVVRRKFEHKHYLWPLPQSEIDKNKGVLVQNPNY